MDLKNPSSVNSKPSGSPIQGAAELQKSALSGTVLTLKIIASQPIPTSDLSVKTLFEIILSREGQEYQVTSNRSFTPGDLVRVKIGENATLQLQQIIKAPPIITPHTTLQQGLREALPLQQSPSLLLNNLTTLMATVGPTSIPLHLKPFYQQIDALLMKQPSPQQLTNPHALKLAFEANSSRLEAKLAAVLNNIQRSHPQVKTTEQLIQLIRQQPQLQMQLQTLTAQDLKAQLLNLVKTLAPHTLRVETHTPSTATRLTETGEKAAATKADPSPTKQASTHQLAQSSRYLSKITALYQNQARASQNIFLNQPQTPTHPPAATGAATQAPSTGSSTTTPIGEESKTVNRNTWKTGHGATPDIKLTRPGTGKETLGLSVTQKSAGITTPSNSENRTEINTPQKSTALSGITSRVLSPTRLTSETSKPLTVQTQTASGNVQKNPISSIQSQITGPISRTSDAAIPTITSDSKPEITSQVLSPTRSLGVTSKPPTVQTQTFSDNVQKKSPSSTQSQTTGPISRATNAATPTITSESNMLARIITAALSMTSKPVGSTPSEAETTLKQPLLLHNLPINTNIRNLLQASTTNPARQSTPTAETFDLAISVILRQIAASLSRVQAQQLNSLGGRQAGAEGSVSQSWNLEIPVYAEGQFRPIQLQIEEERSTQSQNPSKKERKWTITLGFDIEKLGKFYATLRVVNASISTTFWSERAETLKKIQGELNYLKKTLSSKGLKVEQLECRHGAPPLRKTRLDQQLLDIKT